MPVDFERARLVPRAVFASPWDVVVCPDLSREEKIDVLLRWAYDAAELAVAREGGMPGAEEDQQERILGALQAVQEHIATERTGPTEHHGLLS